MSFKAFKRCIKFINLYILSSITNFKEIHPEKTSKASKQLNKNHLNDTLFSKFIDMTAKN